MLSNSGNAASLDNAGNEFTDVLPASLTLVSASATSGTAVATVGTNTVTWSGSVPASGSVTITINATINAGAAGTTISNQASFTYDSDSNGTNDANRHHRRPERRRLQRLHGHRGGRPGQSKRPRRPCSGSFMTGGNVTYTITINNSGDTAAADNAGNEFTDVLPGSLTLVSANASSGTAVANIGTNTVTWNGSVPAGGSVTITIKPPSSRATKAPASATRARSPTTATPTAATTPTSSPTTRPPPEPPTRPPSSSPPRLESHPPTSELGLLFLALSLGLLAAWKVTRA